MNQTGVASTGWRRHARTNRSFMRRSLRTRWWRPRCWPSIGAQHRQDLVDRAMDAKQDRRVAHRGTPALGRPKGPDEVTKGDEVVGFIGNHEVLRVQSEGIGQRLADRRVLVAYPHVLIH